jgi:lipid-binding SYLF domain-containing protein
MKLRLPFASIAFFLVAVFTFNPAMAGIEETQKVEAATQVFKEIMSMPEKGIPKSLLQKASGIAVIPGVIKVGFIVGGRHGQGVIVARTKKGVWSNPSFITLTGGSVGWQIGGQSTDVILLLRSHTSLEGIMKGKFTLGADAAVAAGPVGRHAEAGVDVQFRAEIYSYSRSRGLFAGIALEGAGLQIDNNANGAFYNKPCILPNDILYGTKLKAPSAAGKFRNLLSKYSK